MSGSLKRFVALAKKKNRGVAFTHYFLHREALISKSGVPEVEKYWMRLSKWLTTARAGHYNRGCLQHCFLPRKLLTHSYYCTRK
jgi:hypothetical protein